MADTYNGWTNYETWNLDLWLSNDEGADSYWQDEAQSCWDEAAADNTSTRNENACLDFAEKLKEWVAVNNPLDDVACEGFYYDLLNAAISEIDWHEIAEHRIGEVAEAEGQNTEEADDEEGDDEEDEAEAGEDREEGREAGEGGPEAEGGG